MRLSRATLLVAAVYIVLCAVWSTTWLGIKIGLHGAPPLLGAGLRFLLASACFAAWRAARGESLRLPAEARTHVALVGFLLFGAPYVIIYLSETQLGSGLTAVLFGSMPFFSAIFAARLLAGEQLTARRLGGTVLGVVGLAIVFHGALSIRSSSLAILAMLGVILSPVFSALGQIVQKRAGAVTPPSLVLGWSMGLAGATELLLGLAIGPRRLTLDARTLGSIAYLGVAGTVVAFGLYFWLIRRLSAVSASLITLVLPILALVEGHVVYGEPLNAWVGAGTAVVAGGMALASLPLRARRRPPV